MALGLHRRQRRLRGSGDHVPLRRESRSVARAVPGPLGVVPARRCNPCACRSPIASTIAPASSREAATFLPSCSMILPSPRLHRAQRPAFRAGEAIADQVVRVVLVLLDVFPQAAAQRLRGRDRTARSTDCAGRGSRSRDHHRAERAERHAVAGESGGHVLMVGHAADVRQAVRASRSPAPTSDASPRASRQRSREPRLEAREARIGVRRSGRSCDPRRRRSRCRSRAADRCAGNGTDPRCPSTARPAPRRRRPARRRRSWYRARAWSGRRSAPTRPVMPASGLCVAMITSLRSPCSRSRWPPTVIIATHNPLVGFASLAVRRSSRPSWRSIRATSSPGECRRARARRAVLGHGDPYHYLRVEPRAITTSSSSAARITRPGRCGHRRPASSAGARARRRWCPDVELTHRWSGQVIETPDGLPYIGETAEHQFVATGFAGNGITFGTLGAMMCADAITAGESVGRAVRPRRKTSARLWDYMKENKDYPYYLMRDRFAASKGDAPRGPPRRREDHRIRGDDGRRVSRRSRRRDRALGRLHAHGLPRRLERCRANVGLSLPRLALHARGRSSAARPSRRCRPSSPDAPRTTPESLRDSAPES